MSSVIDRFRENGILSNSAFVTSAGEIVVVNRGVRGWVNSDGSVISYDACTCPHFGPSQDCIVDLHRELFQNFVVAEERMARGES